MPPKVAIIGGGPSGLVLGCLLSKSSIPCTVYELRPKPLSSNRHLPSGSLDLHSESGLLALEACGLLSSFKALTSDCTEDLILADKEGIVHHQDDGLGGERPEIARNSLSELLLSSIPAENVKWEHKLLNVSPAGKKWRLNFQNKEVDDEFDLVVGADGAWSRVRSQVTDVKPYFCGINCITLTIPHITTKYPHLASMVGKGTYHASTAKKSIMSQRGSLDSARIYLMISSPSEGWLEETGIPSMDADGVKEKLLDDPELFLDFGKELKELLSVACDEEKTRGDLISAKPLYMFSPSHTWTHTPGLTLIGDAAHLMTPFAGEGVNCAMLDALQLSQSIIGSLDSREQISDGAVEQFESEMMERMKPFMEESYNNLHMIFADDAPMGMVRFMNSHGPPPAEE